MNARETSQGRLPPMDSRDEVLAAPEPELGPEPSSRAHTSPERWFRNAPAILQYVDAQGVLIDVSDAWLDKFGFRRDEALGRQSIDFLAPESRDYAVRQVRPELFRNRRCENVEYRMQCKDGRVLDVLFSATLGPGDAKRDACSVEALTDVTAMKAAERKLAESVALYKGLVESQTEMVSLATPGGVLLFVNQAYARHHNRRPSELIGANLLDFVPSDFRDTVRNQLSSVCASTESLESENQVTMPDGRTRWIAWTNRAIFDAFGRVAAIHSVGRDIERRVFAETRMRASEARYRLLAESSSDMVMLVRSDGRRMYVSPACRKILGWEPEEMLALTTQDSVHPDDLARLQSTFTDGQEASLTLPYRIRRKDGAFVWVEAATQRVDIPGEPPHRLLVVRDVEQRIETERRVKESEASYRLLADNSSDMVFQLDADLVRRYVSPASREILGYEPSELTGVAPLDNCHPDDAGAVTSAFRSLLNGDAERQIVINRRRHRDGRWVWVEAHMKVLKDPLTGAPCGIIGALRDISIRKSIEDQLSEAHRRLEILAAQDGLTGLANRRTFDDALAREYRRAQREMTPLGLILIDVDQFKSYNDRYGHPAGDECLKAVAAVIASVIGRSSDLAARYGGEEFVVLLPNTGEDGAAEVAERIRLAVRALARRHETAADGVVTVSLGVSALFPQGSDPSELVASADKALYRAKNRGRDQVVNASWLAERPAFVTTTGEEPGDKEAPLTANWR